MSGIVTTCDTGCGKQFTIDDFQHLDVDNGKVKTYFICPHCKQEYLVFYADDEVRRLQWNIGVVQQLFADPRANHIEAARMESKIKEAIKARMDELRIQIEGEATT
ncbi:hypothetical protein [Paenibacillus alvei]|uniref:Transglycosylase n=1 Tax=Paenibacillus alvei TaxID=44250 RepID=A0AAP7DKL9_PAEAL|nr:hypothetical protein [Paenibacillus alvei]NOJ73897.1 hypothetical protein [Paenibacillus alvei]